MITINFLVDRNATWKIEVFYSEVEKGVEMKGNKRKGWGEKWMMIWI